MEKKKANLIVVLTTVIGSIFICATYWMRTKQIAKSCNSLKFPTENPEK